MFSNEVLLNETPETLYYDKRKDRESPIGCLQTFNFKLKKNIQNKMLKIHNWK